MGGTGGGGGGGGGSCFRKGTKILTLRGEIPVEELSNSDIAVGPSGEKVPVRWVGWRRVAISALAPNRDNLLPVRISRGALADNVPKRDLYVSPLHALYLDGWLIPAGVLINGTTITRCDDAAEVVYYHVELAQHSVLLAEGAPAESYLEFGRNRTFFANSRGATSLHTELPEAFRASSRIHWRLGRLRVPSWLLRGRVESLLARLGAVRCGEGIAAPCVYHGEAVDKVRRRLALRAEALAAELGATSELRQSA